MTMTAPCSTGARRFVQQRVSSTEQEARHIQKLSQIVIAVERPCSQRRSLGTEIGSTLPHHH
jgi:hypothetical protein